jgi:DNA-binding NarL/FixJ family response regulator
MSTFIIADDHPVTLAGMGGFITNLGHKVLGTADNGITAFNLIMALKPEYAILDLSMPGMNGLEILENVKRQNTKTKIIMYTMYKETTLFDKAVELGTNGYLLKEFAMEELEECIKTISHNENWFSPKLKKSLVFKETEPINEKILVLSSAERKILSLISDKKSTKQMAELLFISEKTVENHRSNIIKKLHLGSAKNALLIWALQWKEEIENL